MADVEPTLNRDHADHLRESVMSLMTNVNHQLQEIEKLKLEAETDETVSSEADMALLSPWSKLDQSTEARAESTTKADQPMTFPGVDPVSGKEQLRSDSDMSASSETEKLAKSSSLEQLQTLPDTAPENSAETNPTDSENPLKRFALQFEDWIEKSKTKLESLVKQNRTTEEQSVKTSHFESYISCRLDTF
ncbi:uncharacterized protein LOC144907690 [Branchiostoma floridae x Branchiostoma belcheri]